MKCVTDAVNLKFTSVVKKKIIYIIVHIYSRLHLTSKLKPSLSGTSHNAVFYLVDFFTQTFLQPVTVRRCKIFKRPHNLSRISFPVLLVTSILLARTSAYRSAYLRPFMQQQRPATVEEAFAMKKVHKWYSPGLRYINMIMIIAYTMIVAILRLRHCTVVVPVYNAVWTRMWRLILASDFKQWFHNVSVSNIVCLIERGTFTVALSLIS